MFGKVGKFLGGILMSVQTILSGDNETDLDKKFIAVADQFSNAGDLVRFLEGKEQFDTIIMELVKKYITSI